MSEKTEPTVIRRSGPDCPPRVGMLWTSHRATEREFDRVVIGVTGGVIYSKWRDDSTGPVGTVTNDQWNNGDVSIVSMPPEVVEKPPVPWKVGQRRRGQILFSNGAVCCDTCEYLVHGPRCGGNSRYDWEVVILAGPQKNGIFAAKESWPSELLDDAPETPKTGDKAVRAQVDAAILANVQEMGRSLADYLDKQLVAIVGSGASSNPDESRLCTGSLANGNPCPGKVAPPPYGPRVPLCETCIGTSVEMTNRRGMTLHQAKLSMLSWIGRATRRHEMDEYHHESQYPGRASACGVPEGMAARRR